MGLSESFWLGMVEEFLLEIKRAFVSSWSGKENSILEKLELSVWA
jgi:hypothetical protein